MNKIEVMKTVALGVVSIGVSTVVRNAIKATTPGSLSVVKTIIIGVGSFALSSTIAKMASDHVGGQFDELVTAISKMVSKNEI